MSPLSRRKRFFDSSSTTALSRGRRAVLSRTSPGSYNVYIGPHIHGECFECGEDLIRRFVDQFGEACSRDPRHVDLAEALRIDLVRVGVDGSRIADAGACTMCHPDQYYSYRAEGGTCGRHGALAFRRS